MKDLKEKLKKFNKGVERDGTIEFTKEGKRDPQGVEYHLKDKVVIAVKEKKEIIYILNDRSYKSEKYDKIFDDIEKHLETSQVVAFNKKGLEKDIRWEKLYLEFKKFAYRMKRIKFIVVKKRDEQK